MTDGYYIFTDEPDDLRGAIAVLTAENKQIKAKLEKVENILIKCTNAGCRECECTGICEEYLLKIIRGEEDER